MAVEIADTLDRIGGNGDYPLVKSEDASYSNADKTEATNVKDALDELYDVNKKEHLKEFDPNGFLLLNSGAQLNDVNGIKIENNEIAKYIGLALYGEVIYDENGEIVDDTIEWENGKDFNPNKITLHRGEKYRINYYYINDTQRIIIRPSDNNNIVSVQSDWNETDENSLAYIKNKPNLSGAASGIYVNVLRENPGTQLYDSPDEVRTVNLTAFKEHDIILIPDSFNTTLYCYSKSGALHTILYPNRLYKISEHFEKDKDGNTVYFADPFGVEYQKPSVHECEITKNNDEGESFYGYHIEIDLAHEVNLVDITEKCKLRFLLDGNILNLNSGSAYFGRFLYKKFKIIVTNNTTEDKVIYFDSDDEANKIKYNHNLPDKSIIIKPSTIEVLYITIIKINSLQNYNGEIHFLVEKNNLYDILDLKNRISILESII